MERGAATPLHYAAMSALGRRDAEMHGRLARVAETLLKAGASAVAIDREGCTPLRHVMFNGSNLRIMQLLIERGADVNKRDDVGRTMLHWVGQRQANPKMARILLGHAAQPALEDSAGKTPLDLAVEHGKAKVAELLRSSVDA